MSATDSARRRGKAGTVATGRGTTAKARPKWSDLERLVDLAADMLCIATMSGRFLVLNPAWSLTLGYSEDELRGRAAIDLVHPEDRESTLERAAVLAEPGREVVDFENRFLHKDGTHRWLLWSARSDGERLYAVARDITDRKLAQEELERSESGFRAIFEQSLDPMLLFDDGRGFVDGNAAACAAFGLSREELREHTIDDIASAEQLLTLDEIWKTFLLNGVQTGDFGIALPDGGEVRALEYTATANVMPGTHMAVFRDVTERQRAEQAVREANERFRSAFENAPIGMAVFSPEPGHGHRPPLDVNRALCEIVGYSREELLTRVTPADLVLPEDSDIGHDDMLRLLRGEVESCTLEKRFVRGDGRVIWGHARLSLVRDADGTALHGICQFQDVTDSREAHEALHASELRLRTLVQTAHEGIWVLDADDRTAFVNTRLAEMLGYGVEEMLGRHMSDFLFEETHGLARELMAARRRGLSDQNELCLRRKDGGEVWAIMSGSPYTVEGGLYAGSLAMVTDITERRRQEQAVRASAERYRNIIETTSEGVWMIDAEHRTTFVNQRMAEMLGYTVEEMLGRPVDDFVAEQRRQGLGGAIERRTRSGPAYQREVRYRRKDGSEMWGLLSGSPLTDGSGAYGGALAMISDITERKRGEEALARLAAIVESAAEAIFSTSPDGTITSWNPAAERPFGYRPEEIVGQSIWLLIPDDRADEARAVARVVMAGGAVEAYSSAGVTKDGRVIEIAPSMSSIKDAEGRVVAALAIVRVRR